MIYETFPNPKTYSFPQYARIGDADFFAPDIVNFGAPLTIKNLREAYRKGIFPWHIEGLPLPWFCPRWRAILRFSELHIPKSLGKESRKNKFVFTIDKAFSTVINACANVSRSDGAGTWITREYIEVYNKYFELGAAHSVEAWNENGELVGGLYGVDAEGVFCGESMFFLEPNASKLALLFVFEKLRSCGAEWMDIQVMTPHMERLGASEIYRADFLRLLESEQEKGLELF
ncbi:MAG: leucyl/phenylalanyl-tRNA--protein transferase [Pyrinomonadaceae bacterium]